MNTFIMIVIGLTFGWLFVIMHRYLLYRQEEQLESIVQEAIVQIKRHQKNYFDADPLFRKYNERREL
tara:strand:+ start:11073 stop:11273 length:201 start_codon:yes stop_codon:yes gene_type:complete